MTDFEKIDRYEIKELLGKGGMAAVYLAHDPHFARDVAIKLLPREFLHDDKFRARFDNEAKFIASLEHPAIVPVYDYGHFEGQPFIIMRHMAGGSLADKLKQGPLLTDEILQIISRIAEALQEAHQQGYVHRDLKPGNILFDQAGRAYLADFGIAKMTESTANLTGTGLVGTPAYMSPEQWDGSEALDGRADVYALGIILYEMLAGKNPFWADTPIKLMKKHVIDPVPDILKDRAGLSAGMKTVTDTALAKDRDERYSTSLELSASLKLALESRVKVAEPDPQSPSISEAPKIDQISIEALDEEVKVKKPRTGLDWRWLAGGAVILILILIAFLAGGGGDMALFATKTPTLTFTSTSPLTPTPPPQDRDPITARKDGMTQLYVSAGEFEMGSEEGSDAESPVHTVVLDAFWIDQFEITNAMYKICVAAGACDEPSATIDYNDAAYAAHPVVYVSWHDADAYCTWAGRRLPTEAEWEKAARGTGGRTYPWGEVIIADLLNYDRSIGDSTPEGSYPDGASPYGALDMAGNVWEWVADWYGSDYYQSFPQENPTGPESGTYRVLRGGSWVSSANFVRAAYRHYDGPVSASHYVGFRCATSP